MPKMGRDARTMRDALIRDLRAQGLTLQEIGDDPDVRLSAMSVSRILAAQSSKADRPACGLTDAMRSELLALVPHPEQQLRLAHYRARHQDVTPALATWLDAEVARLGPVEPQQHGR